MSNLRLFGPLIPLNGRHWLQTCLVILAPKVFEHHLSTSRENTSLKSLWQWEWGAFYPPCGVPCGGSFWHTGKYSWAHEAFGCTQLGGWCDWLPRMCHGEGAGEHYCLSIMSGYDGNDFLKQKSFQENVRGAVPMVFLVLVFSSPAGSFQTEMSHLWLPPSCVEPHQSHQYYLSPWTGPEEEMKTSPPTDLRKLGFANRSFL